MAFDPDAPIEIADSPSAVRPAAVKFDPSAPVDLPAAPKAFNPDEPISVAAKPELGTDKDKFAKSSPMGRFRMMLSNWNKYAGESAVKTYEEQTTPMVNVPRAPVVGQGAEDVPIPMTPLTVGQAAAAYNTIAPVAEGLTSRVGLGALPLAAAGKIVPAAKWASAGIASAFAALTAHGTVEQVKEAKKVLENPDSTHQEVLEAVLAPAASALMTVGAGAGAAHEIAGSVKPKVAPVEFPEERAATSSPVMFKPEAPIEVVPEAPKTEATAPAAAAPIPPAPVAPAAAPAVETPAPPPAPAAAAPVETPAPAAPEIPAAPKPIDVTAVPDATGEGWPDQYNLGKDVPGLGAGTYSRETIEKAGYAIPENPAKYELPPGEAEARKFEPGAPIELPSTDTVEKPATEPANISAPVETLPAEPEAPTVSPQEAQKLYNEQSAAVDKLSESKLLGLSKQLSIDPKGMSGERLRARIISNAHPEDIRDALAGRGLISGSEAEKWADAVIAKKRGQLNSGIDPEQFAAYVVKGAAHIERGIKEFSAWSKEMVKNFGEEIKPHLERLFRASEELNHEGGAAGTATPNQLKNFLADFSHEDKTSGTSTGVTPVSRLTSAVRSLLSGKNSSVTAALKSIAGQSAPKTSALSEDAGNALVRYASASIAAPEISRSYAGRVLADKIHDPVFANKLGAVLVEDRLRAIKNGFLKQAADALTSGDKDAAIDFQDRAQQVTSLVGKKGSPFANEEAFQAALKDKDINAAIGRHKELVQPVAQEMHENLGGVISQPGETTKAFANLLPLDEEGESLRGQVGKGTGKGDFTRPLKKGSAFNRNATGSADNYNTDYNEIVRTMISGNFEETAKRKLYDALQESGLGRVLPPGEAAPTIGGETARKIQIERRGLGGRTVVRNLWVNPKVYPEIVRGMNLDETFKSAAATHVANALNAIQIKGPVDGIAHIANILTSISGSQGGKNVVTDLIRLRPGINVVDSVSRVFLRARDIVKDSPEIREAVAEMSRIGAGRESHADARGLSKFIHVVDKAARLVRNDMYDNLVERGLAKDSEAGRREFINQIGQYNSRLQGQITAKLKEWGASPFVVAGQAFNRNAFRRITANPGVEAASTKANVTLRTLELAGLAANLVAIPMALNYVLTNKPQGRPGVPFGAVDTGKTDKEGKAIYVDPQQWTGARRGLRITGAGAVMAGQQRGESPSRTIDNAMRDIVGGAIHPFAGPAISTAATLTTGYNAGFYRQAEKAKPGESQLAENAKAAAQHLNPFVANALEGLQKNSDAKAAGTLQGLTKPFTDAAGIKTAKQVPPEQKIKAKAHAFNDSLGVPRYEGGAVSEYSELSQAISTQNFDKAQSALEDLIAKKAAEIPGQIPEQAKTAMARREVSEYYRTKANAPFTGSLARERAFKQTLDGDDRADYEQARMSHRQIAQTVRGLLYGAH